MAWTTEFHEGEPLGVEVRGRLAVEARVQCDLLRDIFRPVAEVDAAWLTPRVLGLAELIYESRVFDRVPELADALEDAGCDDPEILGHFQGPGEHVRGCWAIDLLLGMA